MDDLSFEVIGKLVAESNTFVLVNSVGTARRLAIEQNLETLAILILDWNSSDLFRSEMPFSLAGN